MFCYQCQESKNNEGCTNVGVCGKNEVVANAEDMLVWVTKGLSNLLTNLRKSNFKIKKEWSEKVVFNLFTTITNANFDDEKIYEYVLETIDLNYELRKLLNSDLDLFEAALYDEKNLDDIKEKAKEVGVLSTKDIDVRSLRELITYGIKGMAAYLYHANQLLKEDDEINEFIESILTKIQDDDVSVDELISITLKVGDMGVKTMALLDKANTEAYGNPEISNVNIGVRNNPAILISGHDLRDMESLLKQTEGTGVDVYTHSEMLPANYYPKFKKYKNLVGNYGNSWWKQREEFVTFNGPILFTTNCIVPPKDEYKDRVYTTGAAGFPGCKHIEGKIGEEKDFSEIIEHAKRCNPPQAIESGEIVGGFHHNQVLSLADKIVEKVKNGEIKKFVVMAGCDGRHRSREYYSEFSKKIPKDTVILTAGCAKYRYNKLNLGDIDGIPRVLDAGQCNDSYSLAVIALKLKEVFNFKDINELPIVYNIAWYEQKAVIVLLALLSLGVKNIYLGPTLPAFLSPNVASVLIKNFGLTTPTSVDSDVERMFN